MTLLGLGSMAVYFAAFCRVGACLMFMPGYSSSHLPVQARLFLALAISASIAPLIAAGQPDAGDVGAGSLNLLAIGAECLTGALIGLVGRVTYAAVQTAGGIIAQASGFNGPSTADDGSGELQPELGALISSGVLVLMFVVDFHTDVIRALIESFELLPLGTAMEPGLALDRLAGATTQSLVLSVRIAAPFIMAGVVVNFAFGMVNKIAPQIPVIFVSVPFIIAGSLWLLQSIGAELVGQTSRSVLSLLTSE